MSKYLLYIIVLVHTLNCSDQTNSKSSSFIDEMPFNIKRKHMFSILPDSLGGKEISGFAVLNLKINSAGKLDGIGITKLIIKDIDYLNTASSETVISEYPQEVFEYYGFLLDYSRGLTIVKDNTVDPQGINYLALMVRFGENQKE